MSKESYDKILAGFGTDPEAFAKTMATVERAHEIAQQLSIVHIERCNDIGVPPGVAILTMYQIARFQVLANLRDGNIKRGDIRGSKFAMEMIRDMRHPDGEYPAMAMNEHGNLERDGTHRQKP